MIDALEMTTATHSKKVEEKQPRLATEIASLWPPQGQWTEQDYLNLPDSNHLIELSDGVISIMPPPSYEHQRIVGNFYTLLKAFMQENDIGFAAFAPLAVRLWPGKIGSRMCCFIAMLMRTGWGGRFRVCLIWWQRWYRRGVGGWIGRRSLWSMRGQGWRSIG